MNPIKYIHDDAFEGLPNLKELSIRDSQLSAPPPLQIIARNLTSLTLSGNNISKINNDYFKGCKHLKHLDISRTKISSIPQLLDLGTTVKDIRLMNNNITDVSQLYGITFTVLRSLNLYMNKIVSIEANLLIFPALRYVELSENRLTELLNITQAKWGNELLEYETIKISIAFGNPWHCNADMLWVFNMSCPQDDHISNPIYHLKVTDLNYLICHTPAGLAGKPINKFGESLVQPDITFHTLAQ